MRRDNVVQFRSRREAKPDAQRREPASERLFCVFAGSIIVSFGWGLILGISLGAGRELRPFALIPFLPRALIGLFGANWIVQGIRGKSRHEGIFYSLLAHLGRVGPRPWSLFVPGIAVLSLLVAALTNDKDGIGNAVSILLFWTVFIGNVATHELGHVVAAKLARLPVARVIIGPAELQHTVHGWRLEFSREWISIFGGFVESVPDPVSAKKLLLFAAGGPMATILLLVTVILVNPFGFAALFEPSEPLQREVLSLAFTIAGAILIINLLPSRALILGSPSDGYQILQAFRMLRARRNA